MRGRARSGFARSSFWPRTNEDSGRCAGTRTAPNPGSTIATRRPSRLSRGTPTQSTDRMTDILSPMLASLEDAPLRDDSFVYEPKYDGIRAIADVNHDRVRLWSRLGNEKTRQFPEIVDALAAWAGKARASVILDG